MEQAIKDLIGLLEQERSWLESILGRYDNSPAIGSKSHIAGRLNQIELDIDRLGDLLLL